MSTIIKTLPSVPVLQSDTLEIQRQKINNLGQDIETNTAVLQIKYAQISHAVTCSSDIVLTGTVSSGTLLQTIAITPKSANSYLRVRASVPYWSPGGGWGSLMITRNDIPAVAVVDDADNDYGCMSICYIGASVSTSSAITFKLRGGQTNAVMNREFGNTVGVSFFEVEEVIITA